MEFDDNKSTGDTERRLAESKKLTLQPIHDQIEVESPNDDEVASRHLAEPPIKNASNDTEQDSSTIVPSPGFLSPKRTSPPSVTHRTRIVVMSLVGVILCALFVGFIVSYL